VSIRPDLDGVPETALWTLWFRALAARGEGAILRDPLAIEAVERIDYPFAERFGKLFPAHARIQALRVLTFDNAVREFLERHPDGTVVALGEGMETQFWRVDNGRVRWLTVDLPESVALRRAVLPIGERQRVFAGSALDPAWLDLVEADQGEGRGVLVTAQGLLMYLQPEQAHTIIRRCAERFPGGGLVFDAVPPWMAGVVRRGVDTYRPPPLPWTLIPAELHTLTAIHPGIADVRELRPARGSGFIGWLAPKLRYVPVLGRARPMVAAIRFAGPVRG
jgi:O-methyltransferase involved in polyketide biosynthesis